MTAGSMFFDTLDIAHRQIDATSRHAKVADFLLGNIGLWAANLFVTWILRVGRSKFHRDTIALKGIASEVSDRRAYCRRNDDPSDCIVAIEALERLGVSVLELHRLALGVSSKSARVQAAAKAFAGSASELYETISNLRWEFLELEATMSPISEGYVAHSADELEQVFARISRE